MNMNMIFNGLWNVSIQFAVIVLVIMAVRKMFEICHVSKKFAYFLWIIPMVRLLCPVNIEGRVSLWPESFVAIQSEFVHEAVNYYENEHVKTADAGLSGKDGEIYDKADAEKNTVDSEKSDGMRSDDGTSKFNDTKQDGTITQNSGAAKATFAENGVQNDSLTGNLGVLSASNTDEDGMGKSSMEMMVMRSLLALWALGFLILLLRNFISYFQLKKQVEVSIPVEDGVYKADHIYTAFVLGFLQPAVYLPHYISEEQYRYVLTHEKVHIKRRDYLFKFVASLVCYVYWWNPFVWVAYHFMEKDMEMSCDEAVLKIIGESEKAAYANALLELTTAGSANINMSLCFAESTPKNRIKNIMKYKKPIFLAAVASVMVLCVLFIGLLTTPKSEISAKPASGEKLAGVPDEFFGEYIEEDLYAWNEKPAVWKFGKDGILKVTSGGTYSISDDETGEKVLSVNDMAWDAKIRKDADASGTYEIVWENQPDDSGPKSVFFKHLDGEDGLGDGKFREGNCFKGTYRCMEKNVDMEWQFFTTGTYLVITKAPYTLNPDGTVVLGKKLAFEMGSEERSILYNNDKNDCKLAICREGEESEKEHLYMPIKNLLREGTYHYMGKDGKTRQNFYIRLSGNSTEGGYDYYCGKGAGFRPDYEKTEDYEFYCENSRHGEGTYTIRNGILVLTSDDGKIRYFKVNGTKLLFQKEFQGEKSDNSEIPFVLDDGAVFEYTTNEMAGFSEKDWEKLLFKANNTIYRGSSEITLIGEPEALEGEIRLSAEEGTVPEVNGESNFGGIGDAYTYDDGDDQIGVRMGDGEYHVFYKLYETDSSAEEKKDQEIQKEKADAVQFVYHDRIKKNEDGSLSFEKDALITDGSHIKRATPSIGNEDSFGKNQAYLEFQFDEEGREAFAMATKKLAEEQGKLAVIYQGKILSAPTVFAEITDDIVTLGMGTYSEKKMQKLDKIAERLNQ